MVCDKEDGGRSIGWICSVL